MKIFSKILAIITCLIIIGFTINYFSNNGKSSDLLEVHFIDVGQGDSTLIKTPKENILIDGGDLDINETLPHYLRTHQVKKIDILISTHPHSDHIGGLQNVLAEFPVKMVIDPQVNRSRSGIYSGYKKIIKTKKIPFIRAIAGKIYPITGGDLKILYCDNQAKNINDTSIVAMITYKNNKILFTGDLEKDKERELIKEKIDLKSDVLHVGHHGSRTSSNWSFLKAVNPKIAVISCGVDNEYGHPHRETLEKFQKLKTQVLRTDKQGDIVITSDGNNWKIAKTEKKYTPTNNYSPINLNNSNVKNYVKRRHYHYFNKYLKNRISKKYLGIKKKRKHYLNSGENFTHF